MKTILCGVMTTVMALSAGRALAQGSATASEGAGAKATARTEAVKISAPDISLADLKQAIADKTVALIDCNGSSSYASGHIPGAINYETAKADLAQGLPKDKATLVVAYCGGPACGAYKAGAEAAAKLGYTNVKHFSGGIKGWKQANEKVDTADLCPKCWQVKGSDRCCKVPKAK